jgi:hypothetical protein
MSLGSGIRDPGSVINIFRIPDPGVKKAPIPDPGSGSATLHFPCKQASFLISKAYDNTLRKWYHIFNWCTVLHSKIQSLALLIEY